MPKRIAANRLEAARATLQDIEQKLSELNRTRSTRLLAGDAASEVVKIDGEIATMQHAANTERDRIGLLEAEAEREEAVRRVREHEALIRRIEAKLAVRDEAGAELQKALASADRCFRRMISLGRDVDAGWPWPASDRAPCLLPVTAIISAIQHEIFRVGARPELLGGMDKPGSGVNFPGGRAPRLELLGTPDRVPQLSTVCKQATEYASRLMRSGKTGVPVGVAASGLAPTPAATEPPSPSTNGNAAPTPSPDARPDALLEARQRTPAEERLAELLSLQHTLAMSDDVADESRYDQVVAEISAVSAQIEKEKLDA